MLVLYNFNIAWYVYIYIKDDFRVHTTILKHGKNRYIPVHAFHHFASFCRYFIFIEFSFYICHRHMRSKLDVFQFLTIVLFLIGVFGESDMTQFFKTRSTTIEQGCTPQNCRWPPDPSTCPPLACKVDKDCTKYCCPENTDPKVCYPACLTDSTKTCCCRG